MHILIEKVKDYFNLTSPHGILWVLSRAVLESSAEPSDRGKSPPGLRQYPWPMQYLALMLGVFIQPYLAVYQEKGIWAGVDPLGRTLFAMIIALIIFPQIYKETFDTSKPWVVHFGVILVAGMGWQSLVGHSSKGTKESISAATPTERANLDPGIGGAEFAKGPHGLAGGALHQKRSQKDENR